MHLYQKTLLSAVVFLAASCSIAQERYRTSDPDLKARISYDNSGVVMGPNTVRHVCVAVSGDGDYRIERSLYDGELERLHGKMSEEEFNQLNKLMEADELRSLPGDHESLIRQESERFAVEIPTDDRESKDGTQREHQAWRLQWLNADGESPFPAPVSVLVDWLKRFQPKDGKPFEYADYPDVCPTAGLRLLQPAVAENLRP
ncbi:MAG: hypothetical protein WB729_20070 [Candidatus Sulfotelmatobacter sp.]